MKNEAINYLSSIGGSAWKLPHFHFFSLPLRFSYETECCESFFSLLLRFSYELIILISKTDIARIVKASIVKTVKLQAALPKRNFRPEFFLVIFRESVLSVTKKELSSRIFSGNFRSKCSFKMFREAHYHMTLSNKTPPPRFSRKREMFRFFFWDKKFLFF